MFDINTILTQALNTAVQEAIKPLVERIAALENNPAIGTDTTLAARVTTLENLPLDIVSTLGDDFKADLIGYLDKQEWFWEKLSSKAKEIADAAAENAVSDHCSDYDHDDYDRITGEVDDIDLSDVVTSDNLRSEIKSVLRDASVSIDV